MNLRVKTIELYKFLQIFPLYRSDPCEAAKEVSRQPIRIFVKSPRGELEEQTVLVEGDNCRALLAEADLRLSTIPFGDSPFVFAMEASSGRDESGLQKRMVSCFDPKLKDYLFIDDQTGEVAPKHSLSRISRRFFRPSSALPSTPNLQPSVFILTEAEVHTIDPLGQFRVAPESALADPSFVALLHGVKSGEDMFWELSDAFRYVSPKSGRLFQIEEIPGDEKSFVFALFRIGDAVPPVKVPKDEVLFLLHRAKVELRAGRLCATEPWGDLEEGSKGGDRELWHFSADGGIFDREFTATTRLRYNANSMLK